jgi:hypothetical protein
MVTEKLPKDAESFVCELCDFRCSKLSNWTKHILTLKHKKVTNSDSLVTDKNAEHKCPNCPKIYNSRNGLWVHSKKCCKNDVTIDDSNIVIKQLIQQNQDFKDLLIEQNKTIIEAMKHHSISNNTINTTNSHNKTFNLQVFLNEDCKDAMNISDFMSSIQLQLEELVSVGKLGFVEGISNIIIKNLKALDIHKRPLHCTDLKRETVYIKDNGVWIKDDEDNTKLRKVIKNVAFRNSKNTRLFKDKYPDCVRSESRLSDTYSIIIIEAMGGGSKTDPKESEDKILRRILKELTIDKSRYLS